jgi:hypothetical protein
MMNEWMVIENIETNETEKKIKVRDYIRLEDLYQQQQQQQQAASSKQQAAAVVAAVG